MSTGPVAPKQRRASLVRTACRWAVCVSGTGLLSLVLTDLRVPAASLIAAMLSAAATAVAAGREIAPHRFLLRPAQGLIGIFAAAPLAAVSGSELLGHLRISVVCVALTLVLCLGSAYLLWRSADAMLPATAVLSTLAGGASGISTMAPDLEVDHRYVALSQYLRLIVVTLTLPALLAVAGQSGDGAVRVADPGPTTRGLAVAAVLVFGAGYLGRLMRVPAPFLLAPLLITAVMGVFGAASWMPVTPDLVHEASYVIVGWQAGGALSRASIRAFLRLLPITCVTIAVAIAGCFGMALMVAKWLDVSLVDAYLATTPGGIYAVLAVAHDSASGPVVTTLQVIRLIAMLLAAVVMAKWLSRRAAAARSGSSTSSDGERQLEAGAPEMVRAH